MGQENPQQEQSCCPEPSSESSLRQAIVIISNLISFSHGIRVFAVKWQMLRNKLEELNSSLIAIEICDFSENPVLSVILSNISDACNSSHDLARRCVDLSYSGKLLMQSDLDLMAAKFDLLIKKLSGICTAGVLPQGFALVVSRPGITATKDDLRFYVRDLLSRMKIGDTEMKKQALINLFEAVVEDSRYVKIIAEINDIVHLVITMLDSSEIEIKEQSAKIVSVICGFDCCKSLLIGSGVIGSLVRVLECGSELGKIAAAKSLMKLTLNSDNSWSISAHGGVTALLKLCTDTNSSPELIEASCGVLKNLVGVEEIKRFIIEEGSISTFIKLCSSREEPVQINSIEFLQNIASGDESVRRLIVKEGGIRVLVHIFDPKVSSNYKCREAALRAIENLSFSSTNCINTLMSYGFIDQLLFFLQHGDVSFQELSLKVAVRLSGTSEEAKKAMGDSGFMSEFIRFLEAKLFEVKEMASEGLSRLLSVPKNRKRFVQDDRNMGFLLRLLDQEEGNPSNKNNKFLISILISLTNSNSGRRKIVNSGYLKNIEKLAEAEVFDAKRLVRKLSANKFRSLLSGLWHS